MTDALFLFLGREGGIEGWLRHDGSAIVEQGAGANGYAPPVGRRKTIAVVPGEQVTLHWIELPGGLAAAQAQAAARLMAAEVSLQPISETHLAIGREEEANLRCIALVPEVVIARWLATLREEGIEPDHIVPETLLLPVPEEGLLRLDRGALSLYRGREAAFAMEPDLAELVIGEAAVEEVPPEAFEAAVGAAAERPLVDLRQGAFARRRAWRLEMKRLRRLAMLGAGLLLATLAVHVAQIYSYTIAADEAEEETRLVAVKALPRLGVSGDPGAALERRLAQLRGGGAGFSATASAVFAAVRAAPNVEISALAFTPDGTLSVTAQGDSPAALAELVRRIEASGFAVEAGPPRPGAGRQLQEMRVRPR